MGGGWCLLLLLLVSECFVFWEKRESRHSGANPTNLGRNQRCRVCPKTSIFKLEPVQTRIRLHDLRQVACRKPGGSAVHYSTLVLLYPALQRSESGGLEQKLDGARFCPLAPIHDLKIVFPRCSKSPPGNPYSLSRVIQCNRPNSRKLVTPLQQFKTHLTSPLILSSLTLSDTRLWSQLWS